MDASHDEPLKHSMIADADPFALCRHRAPSTHTACIASSASAVCAHDAESQEQVSSPQLERQTPQLVASQLSSSAMQQTSHVLPQTTSSHAPQLRSGS